MRWTRFPLLALILGSAGFALKEMGVVPTYVPAGIGVLLGYLVWVAARLEAFERGRKRFNFASVINTAAVTFFSLYLGVAAFFKPHGGALSESQQTLLFACVIVVAPIVIVLHHAAAARADRLDLLAALEQVVDETT